MTEDIWTYPPTADPVADGDITGWPVEAVDGPIGTVGRHSEEAGSQYLVVDTGTWLLGKEVLLPAGTVLSADPGERVVHVGRTRDEIGTAPEFDAAEHLDSPDYHRLIAEHYGTQPGPRAPGTPL
ncbi:PRC-barrel domain containing protein [Streptomyces sp. NPDC001941]|uniref:PRC-barrel domain containing protein n=1 Tax=Streptomyces sp. NPDC001941 TaxID=3154659 RepID=UPI00333331FC